MGSLVTEPEKDDPLRARMAKLGVGEDDLVETFVRSGGHGGQNVNKTSTCVMLLHRPTGIQVKCQTSRHQGTNRTLARHQLLDRLEATRKAAQEAERALLEKVRRSKRPRSRGAKLRSLADKSRRAEKKQLRRSPAAE